MSKTVFDINTTNNLQPIGWITGLDTEFVEYIFVSVSKSILE